MWLNEAQLYLAPDFGLYIRYAPLTFRWRQSADALPTLHRSVRWVTPGREGEPGVIGELEVAGAGTATDDPALLEGDDGGRVGGVAFGEGPAGMRDRSFEVGLELLHDGITARLPQPRRAVP